MYLCGIFVLSRFYFIVEKIWHVYEGVVRKQRRVEADRCDFSHIQEKI